MPSYHDKGSKVKPSHRQPMIAEITITATKTFKEEYPDNDFSDEVIIDNFWNQTFNENAFLDSAKVTVKRSFGDSV